MTKLSVCLIGSGEWGSAIAKIVGENVLEKSDRFQPQVNMYMYEEKFEGRKLTEVVNERHENVKYLPGIKLPDNVVAIPDVIEACKDADILIFVMPHQFVRGTCEIMKEHVKPTALAVSLIKGFDKCPEDTCGIAMISNMIEEILHIDCCVMMGANIAIEVAREEFCETTIGVKTDAQAVLLKDLFQKRFLRITSCKDIETIEMCGALINVVAIGSGIVDGLGQGNNTKAAVLRLGLMEMVKFGELFIEGSQEITFFQSCGVADLVTSCYGSRNRTLGEELVKTDKTIRQLEKENLRGQSFQGPLVAKEIYGVLSDRGIQDRFPMFTAIYKICQREMDPHDFLKCLRQHPEHRHRKSLWSVSQP